MADSALIVAPEVGRLQPPEGIFLPKRPAPPSASDEGCVPAVQPALRVSPATRRLSAPSTVVRWLPLISGIVIGMEGSQTQEITVAKRNCANSLTQSQRVHPGSVR